MNLVPPNENLLASVKELFEWERPYESFDHRDNLFIKAMRESCSWHLENCSEYRSWCEFNNFKVDDLNVISDLEKIPFIFANIFKTRELKSVDEDNIALHLTSSGTTGQKSQMFYDEWSIKSPQRILDWIFSYHDWVKPESKVNYLLYTYEPEEGAKLGTAYTDNYLCQYAPINRVEYALKYTKTGHKFDLFGVIRTLQEYAEEGLPVRIFGFPSFLNFTLDHFVNSQLDPLTLSKDSLVFLGGGWKGHQDKAISKNELYSKTEELLGIPNSRLRDGFGSVEHCIPYVECENHQFHIPVYSEVLIRDVNSFEVLDYGKVGYLNFISPYITSVPAQNVLMGDFAIKGRGRDCSCSLKTDTFSVVGRAGFKKNKSCAVSATELLKDFK
jgi:phenylacetate-coenzyme A ligase PaaK-like adenylate-forming protein